MKLDKGLSYCRSAKKAALEWISEEEIEDLRKDLLKIGYLDYVYFFSCNIGSIQELLYLSPGERTSLKKWDDQAYNKRFLKLGLYHYYQLSESFLEEINGKSFDNDCPYKILIDLGGTSRLALWKIPLWEWPFGGLNPFEEKRPALKIYPIQKSEVK